MSALSKRAAECRALSLAAWLTVPVVALVLGCEPAVRAPVEVTAGSDTPEGQLKNVMRRLRYALKNATPAPGSGVVSVRQASHRLIPAEGEAGSLTAEVTIKTTLSLEPAAVAGLKQTGKTDDGPAIDPNKIADAAETVEKKVYNLIYKDSRWELADPDAELSDIDRRCFQYALSDG